ncbi:hypothetical protein [Agrococcus sp. TF02-05]|uniref:hypothetical protein n=1 Tax=Agrococcus sp. TF02-05 TaxID=2815211 RepID=UPI001AA17723|nr:hypothetical protein [Agrococcus sp. TF02-05]MBO1769847.1 hypothetical protein [Agrococcus sp. TF02-05]
MKTTKLIAVPALAAASLLALTGCIQMPPAAPGNDTDTDTGNGSGSSAAESLDDTSWTGAIDGVVAPFGFTLNADGTVDITTWGDSDETYDFPQDVWEGDSSDLTVTITGLEEGEFDLTVTGTAENGQMDLSGEGTNGSSYTLTATQD